MNSKLFFLGLLLLVMMWSCKKVEVRDLESNAILPLATGNSWTYSDTLILETTLPSIDTLVSSMTYSVLGQLYMDYLTEEDGKRKMNRLMGWHIKNDNPYGVTTSIFPMGNRLFTPTYGSFNYNVSYQRCGFSIRGGFVDGEPEHVLGQHMNLQACLVYPPVPNQDLICYPAFRDYPICPSNVTPSFGGTVVFDIFFRAMHPTDSLELITTDAGTFTCTNYGAEWWSPGVGMVKAIESGTTAFYDSDPNQQTGTLRWSRTLKSYHLE